MGIAKLYSQKREGFELKKIIESYYVKAGDTINAGDFVKFVNGVGSTTTATSTDTEISTVEKYGLVISACKLTDTKVFIAHSTGSKGSSTNYLRGVVCTIEGATITMGTGVIIASSSYTGDVISAVALSETSVFIAHSYNSSPYLYATLCTINGTTVSPKTTTSISTSAYAGYAISAKLLSDNTVFIAHSRSSGYDLYGVICTISGTTITVGSDTAINTTNYTGYAISVDVIASNKVFIAHSYSSSYYLYGIVCTISGTSITSGTDTILNNSTVYTGYFVSNICLQDNKVFIAHNSGNFNNGSYYLYAIVCTVSDKTITKGIDTQLDTNGISGYPMSATLLDDGRVFIAGKRGTNYLQYHTICQISGTTVTGGTTTSMNSNAYTAYTMSAITLSGEKVFLAHSYSDKYYLYAQMFSATSDNKPSKTIPIRTYETQVTKSNSSKVYGVALTDGTGGTSTAHSGKINVATSKAKLPMLVTNDITESNWYNFGKQTLENTNYGGREDVLKIITTTDATSTGGLYLCKSSCEGTQIPNHIYYVAYEVAGFSTNTGSLTASVGGYTHKSNVLQDGSWKRYSRRGTHVEGGSYSFSISSSGGYVTGDTFFLNILVYYDLTAYYGAGNEPTLAWCDENLMPKAPDYSEYNLVINGDFSNNLTGYTLNTANYNIDLVNLGGKKCVRLNLHKPTTAGTTAQVYPLTFKTDPAFSYTTSHKCYVYFEYYGDSSNNNLTPLFAVTNGSSHQSLILGSNVSGYKEASWHSVSRRATVNVETPNVLHLSMYTQNADEELTAGMKMYFNNFRLYDLTAMFGEGNEPDVNWCKENL